MRALWCRGRSRESGQLLGLLDWDESLAGWPGAPKFESMG